MIRAIIMAGIALSWCDLIANNGVYTTAAVQMSRSMLHFMFHV